VSVTGVLLVLVLMLMLGDEPVDAGGGVQARGRAVAHDGDGEAVIDVGVGGRSVRTDHAERRAITRRYPAKASWAVTEGPAGREAHHLVHPGVGHSGHVLQPAPGYEFRAGFAAEQRGVHQGRAAGGHRAERHDVCGEHADVAAEAGRVAQRGRCGPVER